MENGKEIVKQKLGQASCSKMNCEDCSFRHMPLCDFFRLRPNLKIKDAKKYFEIMYEGIKDVDLEKEVDTYAY